MVFSLAFDVVAPQKRDAYKVQFRSYSDIFGVLLHKMVSIIFVELRSQTAWASIQVNDGNARIAAAALVERARAIPELIHVDR